MSDIDAIEIIDTQIHGPNPGVPLEEDQAELLPMVQVELAREAMDAVGVDIALAVTGEPFIDLAHQRYPGRFPGVATFSHTHADLDSEVRRIRAHPAMVAGRALVGDFKTAVMRAEFDEGVFDPIYAAAEEVGLPIFNSTHGGCARMAAIAERHPDLTLIIDHIGVAQHPVSPPQTMHWGPFSDLLELAKYSNIAVKLCGAPLLSEQNYPFGDVWPYLEKLFEAFGFDRVMWGSDYTRLGTADRPRGARPRRRGVTYAENLDFLRRSDRLGFEEKQALLGGTARQLLRLDRDAG
ncbi:amidohydrolase family protein [Parasphingopyxis marina]|uniref:Amidohydrolase n=1 Tax=Parasphingopyxis marina TaxID=2761622 RepID=A0A842HZ19_9SPHN|nr:amidohydrolase family protein [Parasphingopyxis marina]MBC2777180.1 amidohydrolase [Parasphingopyxis marina]